MTELRKLNIQGIVDTNNSTSTPLGISGVFTGTATEILNYGIIFISVYTDVASAVDGLAIQQSINGTNWDFSDNYNIAAGANKNFSINPHARYLRVVYTNGAVAQTTFRLQVILKGNAKPSSHRIQDAITDEDDAELVEAIITGKDDSGVFRSVSVSNSSRLKTVSQPYMYAISEGDSPNYDALLKFGTRTSVTAGVASIVWEGTNPTYTYLTSAEQLQVVSSDAADASAGTGIRTLTLEGLDSSFNPLSETVTMNGVTQVTTTNSFIRVFRAYGATSGTSATNVGNITITNNAGTNTLVYIPAGDGQTLIAMWTVPLGQELHITKLTFSTSSNKGARISLFVRELNGGTIYPWRIRYRAYLFSGAETFNLDVPIIVGEKTDIEMRVLTPGAAGVTSAGATFEGWYNTV